MLPKGTEIALTCAPSRAALLYFDNLIRVVRVYIFGVAMKARVSIDAIIARAPQTEIAAHVAHVFERKMVHVISVAGMAGV